MWTPEPWASTRKLPEAASSKGNETDMLRWNSAIPLVVLICFAVIVGASLKADAGESLSEHDEFESGPSFFGDAKEVGSLKSLQNVQVKAELGARRMFVNTNAEGHFKFPSFGKDTVADSVTISCARKAIARSTFPGAACQVRRIRRSRSSVCWSQSNSGLSRRSGSSRTFAQAWLRSGRG